MTEEKRWTVPDDVLAAPLDGEVVLLNMDTKDYHRLNATGAVIWQGLERGLGREQVVARLCEEFPDVEREVAAAELDRFLDDLARRRLIVEGSAE